MKSYTWSLILATVVLGVIMAAARQLSWASLGNNLMVGLTCAILTATVFTVALERDRKRADGLWASEVIFMPLIDVRLLVLRAARWLLEDDPPGVEASERWIPIADELAKKRVVLGVVLTRVMLIAVVELEDALRRVDGVTASGDASRKAYARDLFELWGRYHHLMHLMLPPNAPGRKDLLAFPNELTQLQDKYNLTEHGSDRDMDAAIRAMLRK